MDPQKLSADDRLSGCAYCGREPGTADHTPSKVLLDEPYPHDLDVVAACPTCNSGFSLDEQYVACFIECVISGSLLPDSIGRDKVRQILSENPRLAALISESRAPDGAGPVIWTPDVDRIRNIVLKLARGHAAHAFSAPRLDGPDTVEFLPLISLSGEQRARFENVASPRASVGWPEIGSRAFMSAVEGRPASALGRWLVIQPGRYRYSLPDESSVRIVLSEYLACEVRWS